MKEMVDSTSSLTLFLCLYTVGQAHERSNNPHYYCH